MLYIFLLLMPQADISQSAHFFEQGNTFYQKGEYRKAVENYESALKLGYENAALYYNLGNSYFKLNKIGKCILSYERAKKFAPRDQDILYNLQIAQLRVVDKIVTVPPYFLARIWIGFKNYLGIYQLSLVALIFYILMIAALIGKILAKKHRLQRFARITFVPLFILFLVSSGLFAIRLNEEAKIKEGVVLVEKVDVKSSPAEDATEVFALHEGIKVKIKDASGKYFKILLSDGNVGWLPKDSIEII